MVFPHIHIIILVKWRVLGILNIGIHWHHNLSHFQRVLRCCWQIVDHAMPTGFRYKFGPWKGGFLGLREDLPEWRLIVCTIFSEIGLEVASCCAIWRCCHRISNTFVAPMRFKKEDIFCYHQSATLSMNPVADNWDDWRVWLVEKNRSRETFVKLSARKSFGSGKRPCLLFGDSCLVRGVNVLYITRLEHSFYLSVCLSVYLSTYLSIYPSIYLTN
jgi:hypothetical protein